MQRWLVLLLASLALAGTQILPTDRVLARESSGCLVRGGSQDCRLCHRTRFDLFREGVHGGLPELECLSCHVNADSHAASLGSEPAVNPRDLERANAQELCTSCHAESSPDFAGAHGGLAVSDFRCVGCHSFHELTQKLESAAPRQSHGVPLATGQDQILDWIGSAPLQWTGVVEVGVRGVDGNGRAYKSDINREPGARLVKGKVRVTRDPDAAGVDYLGVELEGLGDPSSRGNLEMGDTGVWNLRVYGDRYEDLFDTTTELHDAFSVRKSAGAELELPIGDEGSVALAYDRFQRTEDVNLSRYREVSNERFDTMPGERDQTADLAQLRADWDWNDWHVHLVNSFQWWRQSDARDLYQANMPLDDREDFNANSSAFTPSLELKGEGPIAGDDVLLDLEVFLAWSRRTDRSVSDAEGVDMNGMPYAGDFVSDGSATGRYARIEAGALFELLEDLDASLRLRYRHQRESAQSHQVSQLSVPPASPPVVVITEPRSLAVQRTFDMEAMAHTRPATWLELDLGYGGRFENLELQGAGATQSRPVIHGLLLEARAIASEDLSLEGQLRAFATDDPYTRVTADRDALARMVLKWKATSFLNVHGGASTSHTRLAAADSSSDLDIVFLRLVYGDIEGPLMAGLGVSRNDYDQNVKTTAQVSGFPVPYDARFAGHTIVWEGFVRWVPVDLLRFELGLDLADTFGDNGSRYYAGRFQAEHDLKEDLTLRAGFFLWRFNGTESDLDDYRAKAVELSAEFRF